VWKARVKKMLSSAWDWRGSHIYPTYFGIEGSCYHAGVIWGEVEQWKSKDGFRFGNAYLKKRAATPSKGPSIKQLWRKGKMGRGGVMMKNSLG